MCCGINVGNVAVIDENGTLLLAWVVANTLTGVGIAVSGWGLLPAWFCNMFTSEWDAKTTAACRQFFSPNAHEI